MRQLFENAKEGKAGAGPKPEVLSLVMNVVTDFPDAYQAVQDELRKHRAIYRQRLCQKCGDAMEAELGG